MRALQIGLSIEDLEGLDYGDVVDMLAESGNDSYKYKKVATQEDFDKF